MTPSARRLGRVAQTPPQLYCQLLAAGFDADALTRVRDACLFAATHTRHLLRGSGKPFACHLVGVASLLADATGDLDLVLAGLLHALPQWRVQASRALDDSAVATVGGGSWVELVRACAAGGNLDARATLVDATDACARGVRLLKLADALEDALDAGPWWQGHADDTGHERRSTGQRTQGFRALCALFAQTPALAAPRLWLRYIAVVDEWGSHDWPSGLGSGWYSSHAPVAGYGT